MPHVLRTQHLRTECLNKLLAIHGNVQDLREVLVFYCTLLPGHQRRRCRWRLKTPNNYPKCMGTLGSDTTPENITTDGHKAQVVPASRGHDTRQPGRETICDVLLCLLRNNSHFKPSESHDSRSRSGFFSSPWRIHLHSNVTQAQELASSFNSEVMQEIVSSTNLIDRG